jgi:hypothetical protein
LLAVTLLTLTLALALVACDGGTMTSAADTETTAASGSGGISSACDLTEPEVVVDVFGGTATAEPGIARNCIYTLQGGSVRQVAVYYYGTSSEWDGIRAGYEENRGPLTDVSGVGDEAFYPGDVGEYEIVVLSGDVAFAVGLMELAEPDDAVKVKELATRIAQDLD